MQPQEIFKEIDLIDSDFDKESEKLIFSELFKIDGLQGYLKSIMAKDIKRYFVASKEQQEYIKGGYDKLMQFLLKIQKVSTLDK